MLKEIYGSKIYCFVISYLCYSCLVWGHIQLLAVLCSSPPLFVYPLSLVWIVVCILSIIKTKYIYYTGDQLWWCLLSGIAFHCITFTLSEIVFILWKIKHLSIDLSICMSVSQSERLTQWRVRWVCQRDGDRAATTEYTVGVDTFPRDGRPSQSAVDRTRAPATANPISRGTACRTSHADAPVTAPYTRALAIIRFTIYAVLGVTITDVSAWRLLSAYRPQNPTTKPNAKIILNQT